MRQILAFIFTLTLGIVQSQVSFFVSPDLNLKMSFNSNKYSEWDSKTTQVSNLFTYDNESYSLRNPFRLGISLGVKFKNENEIILGAHFDGVSSKQTLRFSTYEPQINTIIPNSSYSKSVSQQNRLFLSYKYVISKNINKSTIYILPSISLLWRAGSSKVESGGSFSSNALLQSNYSLNYSYTDFTISKYALAYGIGIGSDLFNNNNYLFSINLSYSHSSKYLYIDQTKVKLTNLSNNESINFEFQSYNRASGLYLMFSKKIQIIPWIKESRKKAHNKTYT